MIHLHGYSARGRALHLVRDKLPISGLYLSARRARTLAVLPRGTSSAAARIRRDRAALATLDPAAARRYMAARGGALRVFYQDRLSRGTRPFSLELARRISGGFARNVDAVFPQGRRIAASVGR